jgi:hypothetical protein
MNALRIRLKTKHSRIHAFQVGGRRPFASSRPGGLLLVEDDDPVAVATLALADKDARTWSTCCTSPAVSIPQAPSPSPPTA